MFHFIFSVHSFQLPVGIFGQKSKSSLFEHQIHVKKTGIIGDGGALALHLISSSIGKGITGFFPRERGLYHSTRSWNRDHTATVYNSITQGKTNWESKTVSSYITTLNVNLNWGNPSNSLQLTIYSPDGYIFGPYYDNADGVTDGRINLNIQNSNGIAKGTWDYRGRITGLGDTNLFDLNYNVPLL